MGRTWANADGGDIVVLGRMVLVGRTTRTGAAGAGALAAKLEPHGYTTHQVPVNGCLHLKSAATAADEATLVAFAPFVDLAGVTARIITVPECEPHGANVVRVGETLLVDATAPRTVELLRGHGYDVRPLDVREFAKAEGALTCKSIVFAA